MYYYVGERALVRTLGQGFFDRAVNAISFSHDNQYLIAIGCDDNHLLGIFHLPSGNKIIGQILHPTYIQSHPTRYIIIII